jgi:hypothetical protein
MITLSIFFTVAGRTAGKHAPKSRDSGIFSHPTHKQQAKGDKPTTHFSISNLTKLDSPVRPGELALWCYDYTDYTEDNDIA